jgi:hypothetical protein
MLHGTDRASDGRWPRMATCTVVAIAGLVAFGAQAQEFPPSAPPADARVQQAPAARAAAESTLVYVYPDKGQTDVQSDRDRYECHLWAVKETGFDPSQTQLAPHQRVQVVSGAPDGTRTVAGAATGAAVGAVVARPGNAGAGALIGAALGGIVGGSADAAHAQQVEAVETHESARDTQLTARLEEQSSNYRRAISACLEGRGYTVS